MTSSRIEPDGRIVTTVKVNLLAPAPSIRVDLVADTGADLTCIPFDSIKPYYPTHTGGPSVHYGQIVGTNFGAVIELSGTTVEAEVENHGGGYARLALGHMPVYVHFVNLAQSPCFLSGQGMLGMDQFDALDADPEKNTRGPTAYLAKRL